MKPQANIRNLPTHRVVCTNRSYMDAAFFSTTKQCNCPWEVHDLFRGTSSKEFWGYFCSFSPGKVGGKG